MIIASRTNFAHNRSSGRPLSFISWALLVSVVAMQLSQLNGGASTISVVSAVKADSNQIICRDICDRYWRNELSKQFCYPALKEPPAPKIYMTCIAGRQRGFDASCQNICYHTLTMTPEDTHSSFKNHTNNTWTFDSHPACRNAEGGLTSAVTWCRKGYDTAVKEVQSVIPSRAINYSGVGPPILNIASLISEAAIVVDGPEAQTSLVAPALVETGKEEEDYYYNFTESEQDNNNGTRSLLLSSPSDEGGRGDISPFFSNDTHVQPPHHRMLREEQSAVANEEDNMLHDGNDELIRKERPHATSPTNSQVGKQTGGKNFSKVLRGRNENEWKAMLLNSNDNVGTSAKDRVSLSSSSTKIKRVKSMDLFLDASSDLDSDDEEEISSATESTAIENENYLSIASKPAVKMGEIYDGFHHDKEGLEAKMELSDS